MLFMTDHCPVFEWLPCHLPWWLSGKESACQYRRCRFDSWVGKIPWRRKWQPTPVFLPGESQGRGAWLAAIYGVAQSRTPLKRLSSSSSSSLLFVLVKYIVVCACVCNISKGVMLYVSFCFLFTQQYVLLIF